MKERNKRYQWYIGFLFLVLVASVIVAISVGSSSLYWADSLRLLMSKLPIVQRFVDTSDIKPVYETILFQVRMPRVLVAALVGCGLSTVGCAFQAIFRNALADPHILGVSSGAALGATIAMLSGMSVQFLGLGVIGVFAFVGAILTVLLVYQLANIGGRIATTSLLLTGTAISTLLSAIISLLMTFNRQELEKVYMWTLGSFSSANWSKIGFVTVCITIGIVCMMFYARDLNIILTGDEVAESLGVDAGKVKLRLIVLGSIIVAACVATSGVIGFVGLIIPHCMRFLVGSNHKILLPVSCLAGATFMILCDTIARTIAAPTELPVGVITAIFGAPYFILLLYRQNRSKKV